MLLLKTCSPTQKAISASMSFFLKNKKKKKETKYYTFRTLLCLGAGCYTVMVLFIFLYIPPMTTFSKTELYLAINWCYRPVWQYFLSSTSNRACPSICLFLYTSGPSCSKIIGLTSSLRDQLVKCFTRL